jgi:hypothetical protein
MGAGVTQSYLANHRIKIQCRAYNPGYRPGGGAEDIVY